VQREELSVGVSLNTQAVAMCQRVALEVDFEPLDRALDAGPVLVPPPVPRQMLRVLPFDLREISAVDSDVSAVATTTTRRCERAPATDAIASSIAGCSPGESVVGDIAPAHRETMFCIANGHPIAREPVDTSESIGDVSFRVPAGMNGDDETRRVANRCDPSWLRLLSISSSGVRWPKP
jgi:hypothetical protein